MFRYGYPAIDPGLVSRHLLKLANLNHPAVSFTEKANEIQLTSNQKCIHTSTNYLHMYGVYMNNCTGIYLFLLKRSLYLSLHVCLYTATQQNANDTLRSPICCDSAQQHHWKLEYPEKTQADTGRTC